MDLLLRLALTIAVASIAAIASLAMKRYFDKPDLPSRFDRADVDVADSGAMLVEFTSPFCFECQTALPVLEAAARSYSAQVAVIDARQRPDLTQKYSIRSTPTILVVNRQGRVTTGWKTSPSEPEVFRALAAAGAE